MIVSRGNSRAPGGVVGTTDARKTLQTTGRSERSFQTNRSTTTCLNARRSTPKLYNTSTPTNPIFDGIQTRGWFKLSTEADMRPPKRLAVPDDPSFDLKVGLSPPPEGLVEEADDELADIAEVWNIGRHTNVTRQGRVSSFSMMLITGDQDGNGAVGYGKGQTGEVSAKHSFRDAEKNMLSVHLFQDRTIPIHGVWGHLGRFYVQIMQRPAGSGLRCHRHLRTLFNAFGYEDLTVVMRGRHNSHRTKLKALLRVILEARLSPEDHAKSLGMQYVNNFKHFVPMGKYKREKKLATTEPPLEMEWWDMEKDDQDQHALESQHYAEWLEQQYKSVERAKKRKETRSYVSYKDKEPEIEHVPEYPRIHVF